MDDETRTPSCEIKGGARQGGADSHFMCANKKIWGLGNGAKRFEGQKVEKVSARESRKLLQKKGRMLKRTITVRN